MTTLRLRLGSDTLNALLARGGSLSRSEVLTAATTMECMDARNAVASQIGTELSARERDVAALIARGLTNRQIADQLVITKQTADKHVARILAKLDASSRAQVAVWWVARAGLPVGSNTYK